MPRAENEMQDTCAASLGFERSGGAVIGGNVQARISWGSVFRKAKVVPTNFRLTGQFNRIPTHSGFFAPIDTASDAIDNVPVSASCTGKTKSKAGVKPAPLYRIYSLGLRAMIHAMRPRQDSSVGWRDRSPGSLQAEQAGKGFNTAVCGIEGLGNYALNKW
jgi:hypothetical protein